MSEGAPYRHNNEKYIAFAFPLHTHFRNLIRRLSSRPATFWTCFNCAAQFCFTGGSCWLTTYSEPLLGLGPFVSPVYVYMYVYYIDFAEVLSEWPQLAFDCRTLWTRTFFFFWVLWLCVCACACLCVCARGEKCDVNTSENETRKEKKNEKPEHKPETSSTIPPSHDSIIVICCDSRLWRTCLRWKKRKT